MNKTVKIFLIVLLNILLFFLIFLLWALILTSNVKFDSSKLVNQTGKIVFYDKNNNIFHEEKNGIEITPLTEIPKSVKDAFISVEDKRFYQHNGIDYKGLTRALFNNIKSFSFKEGGSTISQQLIKNTYLSGEKTLKRKLSEFKLVKKLEKSYTKEQILEMYLNTIYFGNGNYGITSASKYYFNKTPSSLTIEEGAFLAGIIKAPSYYSPNNNYQKSLERKNLVLKLMNEQGYISDSELNICAKKSIIFAENTYDLYDYIYLCKKELLPLIEKNPYTNKQINVFTYYDSNIQNICKKTYEEKQENEKTICIMNDKAEIVSYLSSIGDVNRQVGSTLKPIAVYTPVIESGLVDSCTQIIDEEINIDGYSPKNYGNKYYGKISVKDALALSSNVCAVKLLNQLGVKKSIEYLKNTNLEINDDDANLSLALGATHRGEKLTNLLACYDVFVNNGYYFSPRCINYIKNDKEQVIFKNNEKSKKIFQPDSCEVVREMLKHTVNNGTAKALKNNKITLYAKTGTVGNEKGNTDAYSISFNSEFLMGVWIGSKKNLMNNLITGGGLPSKESSQIWNEIYKNSPDTKPLENKYAVSVNIDKLSLEEDDRILIADSYFPERYKKEEIFIQNRAPKEVSTRFSSPTIKNAEITAYSNGISIRLCQTEYENALIYRNDGLKKELIFDTKNYKNKKEFFDNKIIPSKAYTYSIIPYVNQNGNIILGEEYFFNKIKTPINDIGEEWWEE